VLRNRSLEVEGGSLQELRDAATLMVHDAKTPVARAYFEELLEGVFTELAETFIV
jgi:signal transduction histidine kinase